MAQALEKEAERDDQLTREELILSYLPYVKRIVNRICAHIPPIVDRNDLINAGIIGLIEAVDRYDRSRENKFITYAVYRIRGSVLSELRSRDVFSRSVRRKIRELQNAYFDLEQKHGRGVDDVEVAEVLNLDLDQFYKIKKMSSMSIISLEEIGYQSKKDKGSLLNYVMSGDHENARNLTRLKEIEKLITEAIDRLPKKEKLVVSLYYWEEMTMKEIGKVLNVTESRVSQIHSQAVIHLRVKLRKNLMTDI